MLDIIVVALAIIGGLDLIIGIKMVLLPATNRTINKPMASRLPLDSSGSNTIKYDYKWIEYHS